MSLMKKLSLILFSALLFFLINISITFSANTTEYITGEAKVIDGDSIKIKGVSIRLSGIDAPEKKQVCFYKDQPYYCGTISLKILKNYIKNKLITCSYSNKDKYGRILGTCYFYNNQKDSFSLNKYMVLTGNAVAYKRYSKEYLDDEEWARKNSLGIWQGKFIRPEEWRRKNK